MSFYGHKVNTVKHSLTNQPWNHVGSATMCAFDRLGKFCATFVDWKVIELWDVGSCPLLSSVLHIPASLTNRTDGYCHCLIWSFNAKHIIGVFGNKYNRKGTVKERNLIVWEINSGNIIRHFKY
jgi:hypothetical protein